LKNRIKRFSVNFLNDRFDIIFNIRNIKLILNQNK